MLTLLIKNAHAIAAFNNDDSELTDGFIFIRDGVIESLGPSADAPLAADELIDATHCVVLPGLVNTHHPRWGECARSRRHRPGRARHDR